MLDWTDQTLSLIFFGQPNTHGYSLVMIVRWLPLVHHLLVKGDYWALNQKNIPVGFAIGGSNPLIWLSVLCISPKSGAMDEP